MDLLAQKHSHHVFFSVQGVQDLFPDPLKRGERQITVVWFKECIWQQLMSLKNMSLSKGPSFLFFLCLHFALFLSPGYQIHSILLFYTPKYMVQLWNIQGRGYLPD